jgi:hypothetical protein
MHFLWPQWPSLRQRRERALGGRFSEPQDHVAVAVAGLAQMAELCDGRMVEPYPDRPIWRPFWLDGDGAERQGCGEGCRRDRYFDHRTDMGATRPGRQNSPRAREVSNAGATHFAGQDSKGTPSRLGGPPRCFDSKSHASAPRARCSSKRRCPDHRPALHAPNAASRAGGGRRRARANR